MTKTKKISLISLSLIFSISCSFGFNAPEVLKLNELESFSSEKQRFVLLSNSVREGVLNINTENKFRANLKCNNKVSIKRTGLFNRTLKGNRIDFNLQKENILNIPTNVDKCILTFWKKNYPLNKGEVSLIKDEVKFSFLKDLNSKQEQCNYSKDLESDTIEDLFLSNSRPMMSCAKETENIEILSESKESFLKKIEMLLGSNPGVEFIDNQNPYAELDFSNAPKLDAIFMTTLLYRKDFSGTVLARLIKFHADRGTLVNLIATGYMHNDKDKSLLSELSEYSGNIRVQEYKYYSKDKIKFPTKYVVDKYRNMHMKMIVTLSEDPDHNQLITGGRNVHDGFLFSEKPDFSRFPELNQFSKDESYAYWQDLELKITSKKLARSVYAHLLKFWNRDIKAVTIKDIKSANRSKSIDRDLILSSDSPMMRHFISTPFSDDRALEKLYVDMIDKAQVSIKLSTPYLRPTKKIMNAIQRAINRNVDISIQTRINLEGDTQAWLYEETNKAAINSLYSKVKLYEWTNESILHTKMIIVDGKFVFFGSVNLSRRSFIQDIEHGLLIYNKDIVEKLTDTFHDYNDQSKLISEHQSRKFWASLVISLIPNQF